LRSKRRLSAHGITEGQDSIGANKRAALVAMLTFLEINCFPTAFA
jgi:hypothetical protein